MWKALLAFVLVLAALFIAGDAWLRSTAEERAAERLQANLDLSGDIEVSLGGWPFLFKALGGGFPSAEVGADRIETEGLQITDIVVALEDVDLSLSDILAGGEDAVRARRGRGSGTISSASLNEIVAEEFPGAEVAVRNGRVIVEIQDLGEALEADVYARGRSLVIENEALPEPLTIELPRFAKGLRYEEVTTSGNELTVHFILENARLLSAD